MMEWIGFSHKVHYGDYGEREMRIENFRGCTARDALEMSPSLMHLVRGKSPKNLIL